MVSIDPVTETVAENSTAASSDFNSISLDQCAAHRSDLTDAFVAVRAWTERLAEPLSPEQQTLQSMPDASPVKWHRAHTSWFFETFILQTHESGFNWFNKDYCYLFNSYYNAIGNQYPRAERGQMDQPGATEIGSYRQATDQRMLELLSSVDNSEFMALAPLLLLGLNHEQQHQELILTDYQHAWCLNPDSPPPWPEPVHAAPNVALEWCAYAGGLVKTGYSGPCFSFDNERPRHRYWLESFHLANRPAVNAEYVAFIADGGYENPHLWLADGWAWIQQNKIQQPLYWRSEDGAWQQYTGAGIIPLQLAQPLVNISYYEACAFAAWSGARLPTEHEWEHAMSAHYPDSALHRRQGVENKLPRLMELAGAGLWLGNTWEWTASPYIPYPRFMPGAGAVGEYNGKFMSNQVVLRGYSGFTTAGHSRPTYRNFFYPQARWQQAGLRLARDVL